MSSTGACANCGTSLHGPYCHACGQHESASHPATVGHLFHELTHELLHVDGKIWRTARSLFTRPGELTEAYWKGSRVGWIGPFRILLIAAALHAVAVPGIGPMNWPTVIQRMPDGTRDVSIGTGAERRRGQDGGVLVPQSEGDAYAAKLKRAYLSVRYLAVPIFALAVLALYRRRQPYYAGHVVLAAHYYSFWYLVSVATTPLPYVVGAVASFWLSVGYLWLALRRLFSEGIALATVKTLVLYAAMVAIEMGLALAAASWVAYWEA